MYTKDELRNKLEEEGIVCSSLDDNEDCLSNIKIDPFYEDEKGNEYFDDYVVNLVTQNFVNLENAVNTGNQYYNLNTMEIAEVSNRIMVKNNALDKATSALRLNTLAGDVKGIIEVFFNEMQECNLRAMEAEKKLVLLEESEKRIKEEYYRLSSEIKKLSAEVEHKNQKLEELEEYKRKYQNIELQLKLKELKRKKKRFWEFWK